MPIGAVVAKADVMNWPPGSQGSTFGGNPVSCAAALATIKLLEKGLIDNAAEMGRWTMGRLEELAGRYACIAEIRGRGLMIGIEFTAAPNEHKPAPELRDRVVEEAFQRGLVMLGCGESAIRLSPPLCIRREQLATGLEIFEEAIRAAVKQV
jgi:4-aminobutyrate aminotransferase